MILGDHVVPEGLDGRKVGGAEGLRSDLGSLDVGDDGSEWSVKVVAAGVVVQTILLFMMLR